MLWFIPAAVAAVTVGKLIYDAVSDDDDSDTRSAPPAPPPPPPTVLELNLARLKTQLAQPGGPRVAVLGQPGAGKSSLLRAVSRKEMRPLPQVGVQTDATNWAEDLDVGLVSHWQGMRFLDVPGYDTAEHPVQAYLSHFPFDGADAFVLVLNGKLHAADQKIYAACRGGLFVRRNKPILVVRSFAESLEPHEREQAVRDVRAHLGLPGEVPVLLASSRNGEGLEAMRHWLTLMTASPST